MVLEDVLDLVPRKGIDLEETFLLVRFVNFSGDLLDYDVAWRRSHQNEAVELRGERSCVRNLVAEFFLLPVPLVLALALNADELPVRPVDAIDVRTALGLTGAPMRMGIIGPPLCAILPSQSSPPRRRERASA